MKNYNFYNKINKKRKLYNLIIFSGFFFLFGCGLFLSPFNVVSYEHFTSLKAMHLKLIEDFTEGPGKTYDETKIKNSCDQIDLKFREALEYDKHTSNDKTRIEAFEILYEQFKSDCDSLISKKKLFGKVFAIELKSEIEKNYDLAIKGEIIRRDGPTN